MPGRGEPIICSVTSQNLMKCRAFDEVMVQRRRDVDERQQHIDRAGYVTQGRTCVVCN